MSTVDQFRVLTPKVKRPVLSVVEPFLKLSAVTTGVFYIVGLIVVNIYLGQYGITDFAVLKPECVFIGAWSLLIACLSFFPIIGLMVALSEHRGEEPRLKLRAKATFFAIFGALLAYIILQQFADQFAMASRNE